MGVFDPELLQAGSNHIQLPGDGRQQQRIWAVTPDLNGNMEENESLEEEGGRDDLSSVADGSSKEEEEKGSGGFNQDGFGGGQSKPSRENHENLGSAAGHHRGPGGHMPKLRPRYWKSVAPAGAWAEPSGTGKVESELENGEGGEE
ncbi:hypothetical protein NDU88_004436 [Pleurodeles waltl]|uniref:Uncharacterized protein n=1 Tax=Pleurodeles waltl TaxID=8319 RepID=A0AAV7L0Z8_PLEWA|nr:hypothetical protein NDU88_004436 [Pleurodeles waltl]